jgi:hypothetical protein
LAAGCSDGISSNMTACEAASRSPPSGWTNGLEWVTPLWCDIVVFLAPVAYGAGYMFDSGQRSYISKQVGESEQGALQGTLLSISLITAAFAGFLSNFLFSFFLSDKFVEAFGQKFPGGQFLVSALCFTLAEWNTKNAFATPALSAHDRVQQVAAVADGPGAGAGAGGAPEKLNHD